MYDDKFYERVAMAITGLSACGCLFILLAIGSLILAAAWFIAQRAIL